VGLSNGARIALDFVLVHPEMVESLVLASPGVGGFTGGDFSYMQPVIAAARQGDLTKAAEEWANTPLMAIPTDSAAWALVRRISVDNRALWGIRANPERPLTPPAVQRLTEVRVPVLVISGERDVPLIRLVADSVAKTIPGARQASIPNVGHMANLADPDAFNRVLLRFLPIRK
jgi:pimeloyl-ACP methyl ester carboxylesterase